MVLSQALSLGLHVWRAEECGDCHHSHVKLLDVILRETLGVSWHEPQEGDLCSALCPAPAAMGASGP